MDNNFKSSDEFDVLEEGFIDKLIQKRNERKARKEEEAERKRLAAEAEAERKREEREAKNARMRQASLSKYPIYNPSDEKVAIGELEALTNDIRNIIKSAIPGVRFENAKMGHNRTILDAGHVLHKYTIKIFKMTDDNLKKFISNSNSNKLKTKNTLNKVAQNAKRFGAFDSSGTVNNIGFAADIASADLDDLIDEDFIDRIKDPIIDMGFSHYRGSFTKNKDGLTFLNVKIESRHFDYEIVASIRFITRPTDIAEEGFKDILKKAGDKFKEAQKRADEKLQARIEKDRRRNLPKYNNMYGTPMSEKEVEQVKKLFDKAIADTTRITKSALPGFKLSDKPLYKREKEYQDGIHELFMSQQIISIEECYDKLKKKFPDSLTGEDFDDEDGSILYDLLEELIFDKVEKLGFVYQNSGLYEHKKNENLSVDIDERMDDLAVSVVIVYRKEEGDETVKESTEILEEGLFKNPYKKKNEEELEKEKDKLREQIKNSKKPREISKMYKEIKKIDKELDSRKNKDNKEKPKKGMESGTKYEGSKTKSEVSKILKEVEKMLKTEAGIKEYNNNGLEICKGDDVYYACGDDHSEFVGGVDTFQLVYIDLWDYKDGNPREIINNSKDGWHPVNHAEEKLRYRIEKLLKEKYPHFYLCDYGGDWDTGGIEIGLRR